MTEKISDNVGKKIVEALKMHNSGIEEPLDTDKQDNFINEHTASEEIEQQEAFNREMPEFNNVSAGINSVSDNSNAGMSINSVFQNAINQNLSSFNLPEIQSDFEYPNNVAILNHLIAKLPAGVTKQTGAIIIKQTMEALGIPMKSVLREAQQVQDSLAVRTRECQKNIIECRKQIATLEIKVQQYQKQAVVMNDIINLFMSTGA